jgi:hypothetical protein
MRHLYMLLMLAIFIACCAFVFMSQAAADPCDEARQIFAKIRAGDVRAAVKEFGDNSCHCAPLGGYIAYLEYSSGQDPQLAFALSQPFAVSSFTAKKLPGSLSRASTSFWDKPEDALVTCRMTFEHPQRRPYFLPLEMSYGYKMKLAELQAFCADPARGWMPGFTVRLRPTLEPGLVGLSDPKTRVGIASELVDMEALLPARVTRYRRPRDAAGVIMPSGEVVPAARFAEQLPRLQAVTVQLKIVRRNSWQRWTVKKVGMVEPVVLCGKQEITLLETDAARHASGAAGQPVRKD